MKRKKFFHLSFISRYTYFTLLWWNNGNFINVFHRNHHQLCLLFSIIIVIMWFSIFLKQFKAEFLIQIKNKVEKFNKTSLFFKELSIKSNSICFEILYGEFRNFKCFSKEKNHKISKNQLKNVDNWQIVINKPFNFLKLIIFQG